MADSDQPGCFRCVLVDREETGTGGARHVLYQAQAQVNAQPMSLRFRYSEIERLRKRLEVMPELRDVELPCLPPKITIRSACYGRFDETFQQERHGLLQEFFEGLSQVLAQKYAGFGDCVELCEPLGEFVRASSNRVNNEATTAGNNEARRASLQEDRGIIAEQNAEYEASLQADELRAIAEAERKAAEALAARIAVEERQMAEASAAARAEDILRRRAKFEEDYPKQAPGTPQASVCFRSRSGTRIIRAFPASAPVSALFEFVAVADWAAGPARGFDLKTTYPVQSLRAHEENMTLEEAKLCPSATLLVTEDEDD